MGMSLIFTRLPAPLFEQVQKDIDILNKWNEDLFTDKQGDVFLDVGKSWDGLLYILTGTSISEYMDDPKANALFSNQLLDEGKTEPINYHYYLPSEVKDKYKELTELDLTEIQQRYDAEKMNMIGVYPGFWDENGCSYLMAQLELLIVFYKKASMAEEAIISHIF